MTLMEIVPINNKLAKIYGEDKFPELKAMAIKEAELLNKNILAEIHKAILIEIISKSVGDQSESKVDKIKDMKNQFKHLMALLLDDKKYLETNHKESHLKKADIIPATIEFIKRIVELDKYEFHFIYNEKNECIKMPELGQILVLPENTTEAQLTIIHSLLKVLQTGAIDYKEFVDGINFYLKDFGPEILEKLDEQQAFNIHALSGKTHCYFTANFSENLEKSDKIYHYHSDRISFSEMDKAFGQNIGYYLNSSPHPYILLMETDPAIKLSLNMANMNSLLTDVKDSVDS